MIWKNGFFIFWEDSIRYLPRMAKFSSWARAMKATKPGDVSYVSIMETSTNDQMRNPSVNCKSWQVVG